MLGKGRTNLVQLSQLDSLESPGRTRARHTPSKSHHFFFFFFLFCCYVHRCIWVQFNIWLFVAVCRQPWLLLCTLQYIIYRMLLSTPITSHYIDGASDATPDNRFPFLFITTVCGLPWWPPPPPLVK